MAENLFIAWNGPMVTTAAPAKVATGNAIFTMLQIKTGATTAINVKEWGCSFDADTALTPGVVELVATGQIAATVTAHVTAGVQPYSDPNSLASSVTLSTTGTGYTSTGEGAIVATRSLDTQLIAPSGQYVKQFVLGNEPRIPGNGFILRVRVTFPATVNGFVYVIWSE